MATLCHSHHGRSAETWYLHEIVPCDAHQPQNDQTNASRASPKQTLISADSDFSTVIFHYRQVCKVFLVADDQALLVRQMEKTDKAIRRGDVRHCLLRINRLQVVDDICELQRFCFRCGFGRLFRHLFFVR